MKKISIFLVLILLFTNTFPVFADKTEEEKEEEFQRGYRDGETLGYYDGVEQAVEAYKETDKPIYVQPKYADVEKKYKNYFFNKSDDYVRGFLSGYFRGHNSGFKDTVESGDGPSTGMIPDVKYGDSLGVIYGNMAAYQDWIKGKKSNWTKALPKTEEIVEMFDLSFETSLYRSRFLKGFKESFEKGYKEEYEEALLEPQKTSLDSGTANGETVGAILGAIKGARDYRDGKSINYKSSMPRDYEIAKTYSLNLDAEKYKNAFLRGFKSAYETSYNEGYRNAMLEELVLENQSGYDNGYGVGRNIGEIQARRDYALNKIGNWEKYKVKDIEIIKENDLLYQKEDYRETFVDGYWAGFSEGYRTIFQILNGDDRINSSSSADIPISGGSFSSGDGRITIEFKEGTFYNNIYSTIDNISNKKYSFSKNFIPASDIYRIENTNPTKYYNNKTPILLRFDYYGGKNGGIYKWMDGSWEYLPSKIEDGSISTNLSPSALNNSSGIYAVFIDENAPLLLDIRSHWAKDEIESLVRRGIISGYSNKTFRPDNNISRAEFLILLSRVYDWNLPSDGEDVKFFKDYDSFKQYDKIINYAYKHGYINGYADNTFRPRDSISYREVEIIMGRLFDNPDFRWHNTSSKILYDKKIRSKSYDNMNKNISRAEVSYMLYILNQWKY